MPYHSDIPDPRFRSPFPFKDPDPILVEDFVIVPSGEPFVATEMLSVREIGVVCVPIPPFPRYQLSPTERLAVQVFLNKNMVARFGVRWTGSDEPHRLLLAQFMDVDDVLKVSVVPAAEGSWMVSSWTIIFLRVQGAADKAHAPS